MSLLVGGAVDASKRLIESKLLEWLRFANVLSWRGSGEGLLLECDGLDCWCLWKMVEDLAT
jgi:hypothetical protein